MDGAGGAVGRRWHCVVQRNEPKDGSSNTFGNLWGGGYRTRVHRRNFQLPSGYTYGSLMRFEKGGGEYIPARLPHFLCRLVFIPGVVQGQEISSMHFTFRSSDQFVKPAAIVKSALLAALLALFTFASVPLNTAFAQSATTGAIGGTVSDAGGALLPAASITVKSLDTGVTRTVKSNASGEYRVSELEPGTYSASFTVEGFETYQANAIIVTVGS